MPKNKKLIVVMPAAKTRRKIYDEVMTQGIVDLVVFGQFFKRVNRFYMLPGCEDYAPLFVGGLIN